MSRSKDKGTRFESAVVGYLRTCGFPAVERRALSGNLDKGDIAGIPGWALECKDVGSLNFSGWLNEAKTEALNAGARWWAVVAKRRRSKGSTGSVEDAYVVMPLSVFADLLGADLAAEILKDGAA